LQLLSTESTTFQCCTLPQQMSSSETAILILCAVLPNFQRAFTMRKHPKHKNYKTAPFEENARTWQRVQHKWPWQKEVSPNARPASHKYGPWERSFQRPLADLCRRGHYDTSDADTVSFLSWTDSGYGSAVEVVPDSEVRERRQAKVRPQLTREG
jgi:hypothetical protein